MTPVRVAVSRISPLLACLGLLAAWQTAALWLNTDSFPTAWQAIKTVPDILGDRESLLNILDSIRRMAIGLTLAVLMLSSATALAAPLALHRGVGLHEWLNWSPLAADGSYRWPPYRSEAEWLSQYRPLSDWPKGDELARIRSLGFDFIRLTVDPGPLLATEGEKRQQALAVLSDATRSALAAGLNVVFNLHANSQVPRYGIDAVNAGADSDSVHAYEQVAADVAGKSSDREVALATHRVAALAHGGGRLDRPGRGRGPFEATGVGGRHGEPGHAGGSGGRRRRGRRGVMLLGDAIGRHLGVAAGREAQWEGKDKGAKPQGMHGPN